MRIRSLAVALVVAFARWLSRHARADVLVRVDKSTQTDDGLASTALTLLHMDGVDRQSRLRHAGRRVQANRMERDHYVREWDDAPMPYSIFFTQEGHAIHGSYDVRHLGQPVSHGCVRLSVKNSRHPVGSGQADRMANTKVELTGEIADAVATGSIMREEPPVTYADDDPPRQRVRHRGGWREVRDGSTYYYYREAPRRRYYRYSAPFPFGW